MKNCLMDVNFHLWTQLIWRYVNVMHGFWPMKWSTQVKAPWNAYQEPPTEVPTFICRVDGSWKNDETTSGVGWILQLQDGSIDILGLQGCHRQISPLHTELKSLIWALKCLLRFQRYCNYFVTDSQELVKMIATAEDWPAFAAELNEFKTL